HSAEIAASLVTQVQDAKAKDADRIAAAGQLIELRRQDAESAGKILSQITPQTAPDLARGFIEAAGKSDAPEVPKRLLEFLPSLTPSARSAGLSVFLSRADWTDALLDALDKGKVAATDLSLDQRQTLLSHPRKAIADRAKKLLAKSG